MCVFVDDDAGFETAVTEWSCVVPHVHSHTSGLAIGRCSEIGVIQARAILRVEDDEIVATPASAVVVGFKVSCRFVKAKLVEEIVVGVCGVEELSDGGVGVLQPAGLIKRIGIFKCELRIQGAVIIQVVCCVIWVDLSNAIVAASCLVRFGTGAVPAELAGLLVPRIGEDYPFSFCRIVDTPWTVAKSAVLQQYGCRNGLK